MVIIPLSIFALPLFLGVLLLDAWLLATCVWSIVHRRAPAGRCDQCLRRLVESPVLRVRGLFERKLYVAIPTPLCWVIVLLTVVVARHVLVGIIVAVWCVDGSA